MKQLGVLFLVFMMALTILPSQGTIKAEETKESFTVHYHKNDGTDEIIDKEYASKEEAIEEGSLFTWEGRTFVSWNLQADGKGKRVAEKTKLNEVMKDETTLDVYAIWKEKVFKVNFMDINGDKETIYHEEETKDGKITLPVYRNSEHENEVFAGWKNEKDSKVYEPGKEIEIKEDSTFVAQFMKKEIKAKGIKALENTEITYYSANNEWLEKTIEGTDIINYPEEFRESGLETRKFLYWAASIDAYIDESVPRIKPGDKLSDVDFSEYICITDEGDVLLFLFAIYDNENKLGILSIYQNDNNEIIKDFKDRYNYSYNEDTEELIVEDVVLKEPDLIRKNFLYWLYENYENQVAIEYPAGSKISLKVKKLKIDFPRTLAAGCFPGVLTGIYDEEDNYGIDIIYENPEGLNGKPPVDKNIYGLEKGMKPVAAIAGAGTLTSRNSIFYGWKTYNGDIWKENDLITFEKLQEALSYNGDKTKVNLKPIFIYVPATFDLSSLPNNIEIRQPELIVIFDELNSDYSFLLPDISDEFKNSDYVFVGWKNKQLNEVYAPFTDENDYGVGVVLEPIVMKKTKFKIVYECLDSVTCPIDNAEYELGDEIKLKNMPTNGLEYEGSYFIGWYPFYDQSFKQIPVFEYIHAITNGELQVFSSYSDEKNSIFCDPNGNDIALTPELKEINSLPLFSRGDYIIPMEDKEYLIGWSLTPNNENPDEFLSFWTATSDDIYELIKGKNNPVRLYAQWISEEELKKRSDFIKVTFELDQGNGNKLVDTTYAPKGIEFNASYFLFNNKYSVLNQKLTYEQSYVNAYNEIYVKDLDGENKKSIILPTDVSEVTYEIKMINRKIPTSYMANNHGVLKNETGKITKYIEDSGEDIFLRILDLPIPVADEGYVFAGWKLRPYFKNCFPKVPSRSVNAKNEVTIADWYTLKKEIWSTEELSKTPIYEGNLVDSLLPPYARSFLISKLNVIAVFEPTGKVEYYYDGVKDDEATETLTDLHTGDTVTAYPDKSKDGMYEVDKTDGLPMIVDDDYTKNVIKVYYKKKKTAVTVQYFYDGIEDKEAAYTINDLAVGSHYDTYKDKKKEHYSLATVTIPEKLVENAEENVIKVYYTRNKTIAKIQYYYDEKLDDSQTEILADQKAGDTITTYPDKIKENYKLDKVEGLPLTLKENAEENVIKVYYVHKKTSVTVKYFYDDVEDESLRERIDDLEVGSYFGGYKDKKKEHYSFAAVQIPEKLVEDEKANVIHVYYTRTKTIAKVQYFYDGKLDDSKTEIIADLKAGDVVETYPEKNKEGYHFVKSKHLPLTLSAIAAENVINIYYAKDEEDSKTTSVTVKYYYDGVEDKKASYRVDELEVGSQYKNYEDKKKEHYSLAEVKIPEKLVEDASQNVIEVYYTRTKTIAKVQYYYDGKLDESKTEIIADLKAGDVVETYPEKNKEGYHFVKSKHLPLTLSAIAAENVINIYYAKDEEDSKTTSVTVKYYYDGVEDKKASYRVDELEVGSQYKNYEDKKKEHYSLAEVKIPEKLVEDASQNVIEVYYTRTKTIAKVQYYYDGKLDESKTENIADLKAGDIVETYPEKNKEGYIFEKVENIPLTLGEDASKNIIKVYYVKKEDTEPTPPKEDPQKPATPSKPTTEKPKPEDEVQTSDTSQRTLWIMMVLLSGGAVLAYGLKRRRKEKQ